MLFNLLNTLLFYFLLQMSSSGPSKKLMANKGISRKKKRPLSSEPVIQNTSQFRHSDSRHPHPLQNTPLHHSSTSKTHVPQIIPSHALLSQTIPSGRTTISNPPIPQPPPPPEPTQPQLIPSPTITPSMHHTSSIPPIVVPPRESSLCANQTPGTSSSQVGGDDQDSRIQIEPDGDG